jgi:hypothetical protein
LADIYEEGSGHSLTLYPSDDSKDYALATVEGSACQGRLGGGSSPYLGGEYTFVLDKSGPDRSGRVLGLGRLDIYEWFWEDNQWVVFGISGGYSGGFAHHFYKVWHVVREGERWHYHAFGFRAEKAHLLDGGREVVAIGSRLEIRRVPPCKLPEDMPFKYTAGTAERHYTWTGEEYVVTDTELHVEAVVFEVDGVNTMLPWEEHCIESPDWLVDHLPDTSSQSWRFRGR